MTATHTAKPLEQRYFTRMDAALTDKSALAQHFVPGTVADVGAGSGDLAMQFTATEGVTEVFAFDSHPDAYVRLTERGDTITVVHGSFVDLADHGPFDNIVCSSVLHEVYSYPPTGVGHWDAWREAIDACVHALKPGGRLIIRDGVQPSNPGARAELSVQDDKLVQEYLHLNPYADLELQHIDSGRWLGTKSAVSAALFTLTWGRDSLHREALERYQLGTLEEYDTYMCHRGLAPVTSYSYAQQGYKDNLVDYQAFIFGPSGRQSWFPDTNAVWVLEKK